MGWEPVCSPSADSPTCSQHQPFLLTLLCQELSQPLSACTALSLTSVCSLLNVQSILAQEHRASTPTPEHQQAVTSQCKCSQLAFLQLLLGWSNLWGSGGSWWLQEIHSNLHDWEVPPVHGFSCSTAASVPAGL